METKALTKTVKMENRTPEIQKIREEVEWCNIRWFDGTDTGKRVMLIGDSITLGYGNVVCRELKKCGIHTAWLCTSKSIDNPSLRKEIEYAMSEYPIDLIHFNNGLHGWHLNENTYADALEDMLMWLKETYSNTKLIFASTTQSTRNAYEHEQIKKRNQKALEIVERQKICVDPLAETADTCSEFLTDGVHYQEDGYEILGKTAAACICCQLN